MKRLAILSLIVATGAWAQSNRYPIQETERIQRSLNFSATAGVKTLDLDIVNGTIRITGYDGRTVEVNAVKTIRATAHDRAEVAKQEVKLDITENADTVRLYVDEPNRCDCRDGYRGSFNNSRRSRNPGYRVNYDFEVRVPRQTRLFVRTVNDGDIHVNNVAGDYDVENINGDVEMLQMGGSGRAYALNGEMKVTFASNPKTESYFGSLNGDVTVTFKPDLAANLLFKTFNGEVYTDFQLTTLPPVLATSERRNGKLVFTKDQFSGFRVGRGGPEIKFDGFNGDIRVLGSQ
jgi:hypothetical protein